jgi:hypothetical protein
LFEYWFLIFGKSKYLKQFLKFYGTNKKLSHKRQLVINTIWTSHKHRWYGWLLKGLKDISNFNTKQLFWLTLVLSNKGLSESGQLVLAKLNFCLQPCTYQELLQEQQVLQQQESIAIIKATPHVWWVDNYNKSFGQPFYSISSGTSKLLNWTGWAASLNQTIDINQLLLQRDESGTLLPLVPKHFEKNSQKKFIRKLMRPYRKGEPWLAYYRFSFCYRNNVCTVPLKPDVTGPDVKQADLEHMKLHSDGLRNFTPISLLQYNIGSEVGLAQVLDNVHKFYGHSDDLHYVFSKTDVNIFWRIYQVIFYLLTDF